MTNPTPAQLAQCTCIHSNWHGGSAVYIADRECPTHGDTARDGDKEAAR